MTGRSPRGTLARFQAKVDQRGPDECWPWLGAISGFGYGWFRVDGHRSGRVASRVAWMLEHGDWPADGLCVCHTCDNTTCCNPAHLFLGTRADNNADRVVKSRSRSGPDLRPETVSEIRRLYAEGVDTRELGRRFGIAAGTAFRAATGRTYRDGRANSQP